MMHIIWDFNGTLLDDAHLGVDCDNYVFDALGLPRITLGDYRQHMTMPVRDFYTALGVDLAVYPYETISRLWLDRFNAHAGVSVGLIPGALELIARLKAVGFTQSILSGSYDVSLKEQCGALGLTALMDRIDGLSDESATPKTQIARRQMKALGLAPEDCVLVGDMVADARLARTLGARCVLVPWGHNSEKRLEETGMPIARTLSELEHFLTNL